MYLAQGFILQIFPIIYEFFPELVPFLSLKGLEIGEETAFLNYDHCMALISEDNRYSSLFGRIHKMLLPVMTLNFLNSDNIIQSNVVRNLSLFEHLYRKVWYRIFRADSDRSGTIFSSMPNQLQRVNNMENILGCYLQATALKLQLSKKVSINEVDFLLEDHIAIETCGSSHQETIIYDFQGNFQQGMFLFQGYQRLNFSRNDNIRQDFSLENVQSFKQTLDRVIYRVEEMLNDHHLISQKEFHDFEIVKALIKTSDLFLFRFLYNIILD